MQRYLKLIHFCIVKFGTELKGSPITKMANELVRNIRFHNVKFHCYTDDEKGLDSRFNIYRLSEEDKEKHIHWNMMKFFDSSFINAFSDDYTIYMDIDMVWNKPSLPIVQREVLQNELLGIHRHWQNLELKDDCPFHDSFLKFKSDDFKFIHDRYFSYHEYYQGKYYRNGIVEKPRYGVQNFIWETAQEAGMKISYLPSSWVMKSHIEKYKIYADQYRINTGQDYFEDFDEAILHYYT